MQGIDMYLQSGMTKDTKHYSDTCSKTYSWMKKQGAEHSLYRIILQKKDARGQERRLICFCLPKETLGEYICRRKKVICGGSF